MARRGRAGLLDRLQARLLPARNNSPLGEGVWRRAHDRCRRAVDRYHQMLEGVPPGTVHDSLADTGSRLADLLDDVRARCEQAQRDAPSATFDVPAGPRGRHPDLHRCLSRAAGLCAQASEAAAMARVAVVAGHGDVASSRAEAAARAAERARSTLDDGSALEADTNPEEQT